MSMTARPMPTRPFVVLAVAAVVVRLLVSVLTPGHSFDLGVYAQWARVLEHHSLGNFYQSAGESADHLPGDLYLHRTLVAVTSAVGIHPGGRGYVLALKAVANLADIAAAALAYVLVRRQRPDAPGAAAVAGLAVLWAPSTIVLAAGWGQWDMVSVVLFLAGVVLLGRRTWWLGPVLFGWACLIKPQIGLAVAVVGLVWLVHQPLRAAAVRALASVAIVTGAVLALCTPFSVGVPAFGTRWSLAQRVTYAGDLYPYTTMGAPNIWQIHWGRDSAIFAGLSYRMIGHLLLLVCLAVLAIRLYRRRQATSWQGGGLWMAALAMWGFYVCETRCHERYLVPAGALLLVHAGLTGWKRRETAFGLGLVALLAVTLVVHLVYVPKATSITIDHALAVIDIVLFVAALALTRPADPPGETAPA